MKQLSIVPPPDGQIARAPQLTRTDQFRYQLTLYREDGLEAGTIGLARNFSLSQQRFDAVVAKIAEALGAAMPEVAS